MYVCMYVFSIISVGRCPFAFTQWVSRMNCFNWIALTTRTLILVMTSFFILFFWLSEVVEFAFKNIRIYMHIRVWEWTYLFLVCFFLHFLYPFMNEPCLSVFVVFFCVQWLLSHLVNANFVCKLMHDKIRERKIQADIWALFRTTADN